MFGTKEMFLAAAATTLLSVAAPAQAQHYAFLGCDEPAYYSLSTIDIYGSPLISYGTVGVSNTSSELGLEMFFNAGYYLSNASIVVNGTTYGTSVFTNIYNGTPLPRANATATIPVPPIAHSFTLFIDATVQRYDLFGNIISTFHVYSPVIFELNDCSPQLRVAANIKPESNPSPVNLKSRGNTPIAFLASPEADLSIGMYGIDVLVNGYLVQVSTTGNGEPRIDMEDINDDGLEDLVVHIETSSLWFLEEGDVSITGWLLDDTLLDGFHDGLADPVIIKN